MPRGPETKMAYFLKKMIEQEGRVEGRNVFRGSEIEDSKFSFEMNSQKGGRRGERKKDDRLKENPRGRGRGLRNRAELSRVMSRVR